VSAVESIEFLKLYAPEGPWDLVAFPIEGGGPKAKRFAPVQADECGAWIEQRAADGHNLYFHVNPNNAPDRKAKKGEVTEVRYLHVDLDAHEGEDLEDALERISKALFEELPTGIHQPTFVTDSGNGRWAFWKLAEPIQLDGTEECAEEAERFNRALEAAFEGDNCHNVDRVARLPGIDNRPNEKKRTLGRVTRETSMVKHWPENVYPSAAMPKALRKDEVAASPTAINAKGSPVNVARDDVEVFTGADTKPLEALGLRPETVATILHGWNIIEEPEKPAAHDRSLTVFHISCELERREVPDNVKAGIFLNESWAINEHNFAQKEDTFKYVTRQIERGKDAVATEMANKAAAHDEGMANLPDLKAGEIDPYDTDLLLAWGNSKYAVLGYYGGKTVVLNLESGAEMEYLSVPHFRDLLSSQSVLIPDPTPNNPLKVKVQSFGQWWMTHPERNTFHGTCFHTGDNPPTDRYNLYRGFAVEPSNEGSCQLYMEHLRDNICRGDEPSFEYAVKWMARAVQHPELPGGSALVLKGSRGTGKGTFANWFGKLWHPAHYFASGDGKMFTGEFTKHLDPVVIAFADEAIFAADRKGEGALKTLITEDTRSSHGKGMTPTIEPNHVHLIMASNSDWVVPAGAHERRYLVLDVSEDRRQDNEYFEAIKREMLGGGLEALLHLLLHIDLDGFDVFNAPKTAALRAQSDQSLSHEEQWWLEKLETGQLYDQAHKDEPRWPDTADSRSLTDDYHEFVKAANHRHPLGPQALGQKYREWGFPSSKPSSRGGRSTRLYRNFPDLETMRANWDEKHGGNRSWPVVDAPASDDDPVF